MLFRQSLEYVKPSEVQPNAIFLKKMTGYP